MKKLKISIIMVFASLFIISCENEAQETSNYKKINLDFEILTDKGHEIKTFTNPENYFEFLKSKEYAKHLELVEELKNISKDFENEFLVCKTTRIEVTNDGDFIEHETCCSKEIGDTGGGCFDVAH